MCDCCATPPPAGTQTNWLVSLALAEPLSGCQTFLNPQLYKFKKNRKNKEPQCECLSFCVRACAWVQVSIFDLEKMPRKRRETPWTPSQMAKSLSVTAHSHFVTKLNSFSFSLHSLKVFKGVEVSSNTFPFPTFFFPDSCVGFLTTAVEMN